MKQGIVKTISCMALMLGFTQTTAAQVFDSSSNAITWQDRSYKMVYVSGGTFTMGATEEQESDAYDWERPAHSVTLSSYHIGQTEVPQWLWTAVMGSNPSFSEGDHLPVESVSWDDCQNFINKLNSITGMNFALPTEAQWEFAVRGGNSGVGYKYSGSDDIDDVAWYADNSDDETCDVGTKSANELGLYDMSGNVWEWCSDWYGDYPSSSQTDPKGPDSGASRVIRGGSWNYVARDCRVSSRDEGTSFSGDYTAQSYRSFNLGFRLALLP